MNNLFLCKTPYQIMVAIQLVLTEFKADNNDIFVGDTIADSKRIMDNLIGTKAFRTVRIFPTKSVYSKYTKYDCIKMALKEKMGLKNNLIQIDDAYDRLFICNLSLDETILYRCIRCINRCLKVYLFEDGFATYTKMYGQFFDDLKYGRTTRNALKTFYKRINYEVFVKLNGVYLFTPELMDWKPCSAIRRIKKINPDNKEMVKVFNKAFGAETLSDDYSEKYIFFEESYFADGIYVEDEEILDKISDIVGKNNLFVKIHPRNPINRFKKKGYKTNENTIVPWEIVALNIDIENKVLLTIASGSALTSLVNVSTKPKMIIMLMDCKEIDKKSLTPSVDMLRKVAENYKDVVILPNSLNDLNECFEKVNLPK